MVRRCARLDSRRPFAIPPAFLERLDNAAYDTVLRAASAQPPGGQVLIVDIDERSLSTLGQWPWPRDLVGRLVARLRELGAAVVGLDIIFAEADRYVRDQPLEEDSDPSPNTMSDLALAETLREGRVVLGYALTFEDDRSSLDDCALHPLGVAIVEPRQASAGDPLFRAGGAICNLPVLARAAAASGFLNAAPDSDGVLRRRTAAESSLRVASIPGCRLPR